MYAPGGTVAAPRPSEYPNASLATAYVSLSGAGGLKALELQKMLAGQLASVVAVRVAADARHQRIGCARAARDGAAAAAPAVRRARRRSRRARAAETTARCGAREPRCRIPRAVFGEKVGEVNTLGALHRAAADARAGRGARSRRRCWRSTRRGSRTPPISPCSWPARSSRTRRSRCWRATWARCRPPGSRRRTAKDVRPAVSRRRSSARRSRSAASRAARPSSASLPIRRRMRASRSGVAAATDVLEIALRDILREELGQTYNVSVSVAQRLPLRGGGYVAVAFGADPANLGRNDRARAAGGRAAADRRVRRPTSRTGAKEAARRGYETALTAERLLDRQACRPRIISGQDPARDPRAPASASAARDAGRPAARRSARYFPPRAATRPSRCVPAANRAREGRRGGWTVAGSEGKADPRNDARLLTLAACQLRTAGVVFLKVSRHCRRHIPHR